jgi:hypothetical protein
LLAILMLTIPLAAGAQPSAREAIQAEYDKVAQAADLKYVDGMEGCRANGFVAFDPHGVGFNLVSADRELRQAFANAVSVKDNLQVMTFKQIAPTKARCRVHDVVSVTTPAQQGDGLLQVVFDSTSDDDWSMQDGWQETACHFISQSMRRQFIAPAPASNKAQPSVPHT